MPLSPIFRQLDFTALPGWDSDAVGNAFAAFRLSAVHALETPYKTGSAGVAAEAFRAAKFVTPASTPPAAPWSSVRRSTALTERPSGTAGSPT